MQTLAQAHQRDAAYWGDRPDWLIVLAKHRDSECLDLSNFRVAHRALGAIDEDAVTIERSSHWAVGWIDYLLVNPEYPITVAKANELLAQLEDYPVLSDDDWVECQSDCAADCGYSYECFTDECSECRGVGCVCSCHPPAEDDE